MKERILEYIKKINGNVSFIELQDKFPQMVGEEDFGQPDFNLLFWPNVTLDFIESINALIKEDKLMFSPCEPLLYMAEGVFINAPVAEKFKRYGRLHWYPMVFSAL